MRGGRLYLIFIGILLCLAGGGFTWLMWRSFDRAAGQRDWVELKGAIIESRIEERKIGSNVKTEYRCAVLYGYRYEGESYTSERFSLRGSPWSSKTGMAERRLEDFPVGEEVTCYVDPAEPSFSVLKLDSKAPGYSLWFPLIFVVGGLGIILGALRGLVLGGPAGESGRALAE